MLRIWAALACVLAAVCVLVSLAIARDFGGDDKKILRLGVSSGPKLAVSYPGERILLQGVFFGSRGLVRLMSNGARDRSFGGDGYVPIDVLGPIGDLAIQANGKIIVVGDRLDPPSGRRELGVIRLNSTGRIDRSFGADGLRKVNFGEPWESGRSVAIQNDGKILIGGTNGPAVSRVGESSGVIARFHPNGRLDRSFSEDGWLTLPSGVNVISRSVEDIAVATDGAVVAAIRGDSGMEIFRFLRSQDPAFGRAGRITVDLRGFDWRQGRGFQSIEQVGLVTGGRIVVAGTASYQRPNRSPRHSIVAVRYLKNGRLDRSFGDGGVAEARFRNFVTASAFGVQRSGRIFVAGGAYAPKRVYAAVAFRPDGDRLDPHFGLAGKVKVGFARRDWEDRLKAVVLQARGRVMLVGYTQKNDHRPPYPRLTALARLSPHPVR
jgi:uncharacterized delta-60 repeat protein